MRRIAQTGIARPGSVVRVLAVTAAVLAGGCAREVSSWNYDYRVEHRNIVNNRNVTLEIREGTAPLTSSEASRIVGFAREYVRRGEGGIEMLVPATMEARGGLKTRLQQVSNILVETGINPDDVRVRFISLAPEEIRGLSGELAPHFLMLSFTGVTVDVPECGNWSSAPSGSRRNQPADNFGCSTQRNIGLMVSNPKDLVRMRDADPRDGARAATIYGKYIAGEDTASSGEVTATISTAVGN